MRMFGVVCMDLVLLKRRFKRILLAPQANLEVYLNRLTARCQGMTHFDLSICRGAHCSRCNQEF